MCRLQTTPLCEALSRTWQVNQVSKSKTKTVYFSAENLRADVVGFILHIYKNWFWQLLIFPTVQRSKFYIAHPEWAIACAKGTVLHPIVFYCIPITKPPTLWVKVLLFLPKNSYQTHAGHEDWWNKYLNTLLVSLHNDSISSKFLEKLTGKKNNSVTTFSWIRSLSWARVKWQTDFQLTAPPVVLSSECMAANLLAHTAVS